MVARRLYVAAPVRGMQQRSRGDVDVWRAPACAIPPSTHWTPFTDVSEGRASARDSLESGAQHNAPSRVLRCQPRVSVPFRPLGP